MVRAGERCGTSLMDKELQGIMSSGRSLIVNDIIAYRKKYHMPSCRPSLTEVQVLQYQDVLRKRMAQIGSIMRD